MKKKSIKTALFKKIYLNILTNLYGCLPWNLYIYKQYFIKKREAQIPPVLQQILMDFALSTCYKA